MRWGLIPSWATDPTIGARMINARSETAASKPSFREPLEKRRCLVPADGFYEWSRGARGKQPFCFDVGDGGLFAFAGLWDRWRGPDGQAVESCTILTTTPNSLLADVHDRMPGDPGSGALWPLARSIHAGRGDRCGPTPALRLEANEAIPCEHQSQPGCKRRPRMLRAGHSASGNCHTLRLIGVCGQRPALRVNERN